MRERVSTFASVCAEKLRLQHSCCQTIIVMLNTVDYNQGRRSRYYQQVVTLPFATNSTLTLVDTAVSMLQKLYAQHEGLVYKKAGVIVTQLCPENEKQFHLFEDENPKHLPLMKAMDAINQKMGSRKVRLGAQGTQTWNMKQHLLSPKYTTQFDQILTIRCQ